MSAVAPESTPPAPATAALSVERVSKIFGGLVAVNDVSLDVPAQSIVSLIGPNGAGKTTLFNMLTGLYKPSTGRILLGQREITRMRPDRITALGVARTFQNIRLFGAMTAVENVMIGRHSQMRAGLVGSILRAAARAARGASDPRARPGAPGLRRAAQDRHGPALHPTLLRRPAPRRDRPRAGVQPDAAAAR